MAESFTLTNPVNLSQTKWDIDYITFAKKDSIIAIRLYGNNGETLFHTYSGSIANTLMNQVNTGNFTTTSLHKTIFNRLRTDGIIPVGTITGSPD